MLRLSCTLILCGYFGIYAEECYDDGNEFCIDQNDILAVDLLPGSLLLMDQLSKFRNGSNDGVKMISDGSFFKAFDSMDYHRKRMNEYLCHGFVAEEIFKEVGPTRVKRRPQLPSETSLIDFLGEENITVHDKLLSDEGSSKYKDWLQRTTTLDDIYRHYAPRRRGTKSKDVRRDDEDDDELDDFDGEVTGYVLPARLPSGKIGNSFDFHEDHLTSPAGHNFHHGDYIGHHADFYPAIHQEEYYYTAPNHHDDDHHYYQRPSSYGKGKGHDLSIKDFFEIALTALAFLAFGLFVIQLLINVTNVTTVTAASLLQADIDGTRYKRHATTRSSLSYSGNQELNELSFRVLRSIEAAIIANQDTGNCLRRTLCVDNRLSKEYATGQRIWVPVWSLGMSWISGRVLDKSPWSAMLDSVKASVLGLGGADCETLYPNCDLKRERIKRRRRRRK
ncbi:uncharacterized protein LOC107272229 isoform X2 [Cephus cinctus]|uniref:Uncharacterized protein LOC107272229 isoform X2 n=1 Tax=Cephus cinctus TaxID=211228 RepID=A0AAJ7RQP2_CEPCN|nr:uncharacterized protein LOC107272229 isoform X2 [Cephus cinctus]